MDSAQDVTEDMLGAAKEGSAKVLIVRVLLFILSIVICQRRNPRNACP